MQTSRKLAPNVDSGKLSQLLSCAHALVTQEAISLGLPDFPLDNLFSAAIIMVNVLLSRAPTCLSNLLLISALPQDKCPHLPVFDIFYRFYPYKLFLGKEGQTAVEGVLKTFNILDMTTNDGKVTRRVKVNERTNDSLNVTIQHNGVKTTLDVSGNI